MNDRFRNTVKDLNLKSIGLTSAALAALPLASAQTGTPAPAYDLNGNFVTPVVDSVKTMFTGALPAVAGLAAVLIAIPFAWRKVRGMIKGS